MDLRFAKSTHEKSALRQLSARQKPHKNSPSGCRQLRKRRRNAPHRNAVSRITGNPHQPGEHNRNRHKFAHTKNADHAIANGDHPPPRRKTGISSRAAGKSAKMQEGRDARDKTASHLAIAMRHKHRTRRHEYGGEKNGASDGARTRDLRRDRPAL